MGTIKKTCSICGRDLSKWNLDFTREIVCGNCNHDWYKRKRPEHRGRVDIDSVKKLYDAIINQKISHPLIIPCLEQITGHAFTSTKDFCQKMNSFFAKHFYRGCDLRKARKWSEMEQSHLAEWLGVPINRIKQMETNKSLYPERPLTLSRSWDS